MNEDVQPEQTSARSRWRRRWWPVAGVAAAALVVGAGGGWAVARHGERTSGSPAGSRAGAVLDAAARGALAPTMLTGSGEHLSFTGRGLAATAGTATVWAFDESAALKPEAVAKAAAALGLHGVPVAQWGSWQVGSTDGNGPSFSVSGDGQASATYNDPTVSCSPDVLAPDNPGMPTTPATPPGVVVPVPTPLAVPPSRGVEQKGDGSTGSSTGSSTGACAGNPLGADLATAKARDLLVRVGADLRDARTSVSTDGATSTVEVDQRIAGQDTGVSWSVTFVGERLAGLWGPLARLVDLGPAALLSPARAVDRLSDPRFGTSGAVHPINEEQGSGSVPVPAVRPAAAPAGQTFGGVPADQASGSTSDGTVSSSDAATPDPAETAAPTPSPVPTAGSPLAWRVTAVTLVKADLVLVPTPLTDGSTVLLPTYRFTDTDGATWDVAALADSALAFGG